MRALNDSAGPDYVAFISYSHRDRKWAAWLHRALETYRPPRQLRNASEPGRDIPRRLTPIFLDREELSSSSALAASVQSALERSRNLIVICSPGAARSRWVNEEIRLFKSLGRADRIFCLIVAGEPGALPDDSATGNDCFPPALRFAVVDGQVTTRPTAEPLAADVRDGMDRPRDAKLKIAAGLLGVSLDELRQRETARRQKRLLAVAAAAVTGCVILTGLTAVAIVARNEADRQRQFAEQQSLTAQRTVDFLKSLFQVSDPGEARGNSITAREILDRGVRQIDSELRDQPAVQAELMTTLGEVYTSLGLYRSGVDLLTKARQVPGQGEAAATRQTTALAEMEVLRGNYDQADQLYEQALASIRSRKPVDPIQLARALIGRGEVLASREQYEEARTVFREGIETARKAAGGDGGLIARGTEGLALAYFLAGDLDAAEASYRQALEMRIATSGEFHPKVSETLNSLGAIEYMRGDNQAAQRYYERALPIDRKVLGERHPDVAGTMNNLARVYLEQRNFSKAAELLQESSSIMLAEKDETTDDMAFVFSNLGLVYMARGEYPAAGVQLNKALNAAVLHHHRLHGPILTDLADLDCRTGHFDEGLRQLEVAKPIVSARYPDDPWRMALVENVEASCLAGKGRLREATILMNHSTDVLLKRWRPDSLFGHDTIKRATALYTLTGDNAELARYKSLAGRG